MSTLESQNHSELLTRVSHELRTPLTSILGYAEVMLTDPKLSAESRHHYAEVILHEGWRLSHIIDDCMDIAFSSGQRPPVHSEPLDVSFTVDQILDALRPTMEERSVHWKLIGPEAPIQTSANPLRWRQVIQNFILNAVKLSPRGGRVEVELIPYEQGYEIEIRSLDLVPGEKGMDVLRNEFVWHHAPKVELRERGVGFAFAKHLLELQGGSLTMKEQPAGGVIFLLRFSIQ